LKHVYLFFFPSYFYQIDIDYHHCMNAAKVVQNLTTSRILYFTWMLDLDFWIIFRNLPSVKNLKKLKFNNVKQDWYLCKRHQLPSMKFNVCVDGKMPIKASTCCVSYSYDSVKLNGFVIFLCSHNIKVLAQQWH